MDTSAILAALSLGEEKDWKFKAARGGLPGSVWDTYSAMANTDGGVVVLGVAQKDGRFVVEGVPDAPKMKQDFWNLANNRGKVSTNLLSNDNKAIEGAPSWSVVFDENGRRWCGILDHRQGIWPELAASHTVG